MLSSDIVTPQSELSSDSSNGDKPFISSDDDDKLHLIQQFELSDLIRNLNLTKDKTELLPSRLQERGIYLIKVCIQKYAHIEREVKDCPVFMKCRSTPAIALMLMG